MAEENKDENTEQNEQNNKTENINYNSLAPTESDNYDKYNDAFKFALDSNGKSQKITNIAVTGPYASGKSSITENVKKEFGSNNFITLSLTDFNNIDSEYNTKEENKKTEEDLEAQLINQLIHKIDKNKIQESRFLINHKIDSDLINIKDNIYKNKKLIFLLVTSITILSLSGDMFVNTTNLVERFLSKYINIIFSIFEAVKLIAIFIIAGISIKFLPDILYKIVSLIKKNKFKRINLYGNEIELFTNENDSIFDKYTDEILYLFKNAGVKYFIFEDMDRYEDVTIFKKLRKINILLNEKLKKKRNNQLNLFT